MRLTVCTSLVGTFALANALLATGTAHAQDAEPDASTVGGIQDIIVTAERRANSLEKTPVAITVMSSEALATNKIDNANDLVKFAPGLSGGNNVGNSVASYFFIRGLGQDDSSPLVDPAVGIYIDDVYVARQYSNNLFMYDIEQVEILRGPQGILYGRNTTGGAVRVSTIKPSDEFKAKMDAEYGNYASYSLKGAVNIPVTDNLYVRTGVFTKQRDRGYVKNIFTGEDTTVADQWGGRIAVRYVPTDELTFDLAYETFRSDTPGDRGANVLRPTSDAFHTESGLIGGFSEIGDDRASLTITYDTDAFTLKSISAFDHAKWSYLNDFSGEPIPQYILYAGYESKVYSQELQLSTEFMDGRLQATLGAFAYSEKGNNYDGQNVLNGLIESVNYYTNKTTSMAAYGQLRMKLTDALSMSAGLRYTDEKRRLNVNGYDLTGGRNELAFDNSDIIAAGNKTKLHFRKVSPKFGLEYQITPAVMAYASYTEGFRSGSFNQRAFNAQDFTTFDPEEVKAYEGGLKGLFFDRKLRASVSVYRNDYGNFIVNQVNPNTGNFVTANAAKVRIQGVEGELAIQVTPRLNINATTAYMDAKYQAIDDGVGIPVTNKVKWTPKFTGSIGFDYDFAAPLDPRLTVNYFHSSRYYAGLANVPTEHVPYRDLLDAQFTIKPTKTTTLGVFCQNCLDDRYFVSAIAAEALGFVTQTVGNPRTYGVRFSFSY